MKSHVDKDHFKIINLPSTPIKVTPDAVFKKWVDTTFAKKTAVGFTQAQGDARPHHCKVELEVSKRRDYLHLAI